MYGDRHNKDAIVTRLRCIEGQVRGLVRMVESDTSCIDILTQVSAATRALQAVALELVEDHLNHCVADAITSGGAGAERKVAEPSRRSRGWSNHDGRGWGPAPLSIVGS